MNSEAILLGFFLFAFISLAFVSFCVYFIFKSLEFVITATNLYRSMLSRLDLIVKLMSDQQKTTSTLSEQKRFTSTLDKNSVCPNCNKKYENIAPGQFCEECGAQLS